MRRRSLAFRGALVALVLLAGQSAVAGTPASGAQPGRTHPFLVRSTSIGRVHLGETGTALRRAYPKAQSNRYGAKGCVLYSVGAHVSALVTPRSHKRIAAASAYGTFTTSRGLHDGSSPKQVLAAYPHKKHERFTDGFGEVHVVVELQHNWIGFWFSGTGAHKAVRADRVGVGPRAYFADAGPPAIAPCGQ